MKLEIKVFKGGVEVAGRSAEPPTTITVGRSDDNDIVLPEGSVSRKHALIVWEEDGWLIRDQGSTNGIKVGGARVQEHRLMTGDRIDLEPFVIDVIAGGVPVQTPEEGVDRTVLLAPGTEDSDGTIVGDTGVGDAGDHTMVDMVAPKGGTSGFRGAAAAAKGGRKLPVKVVLIGVGIGVVLVVLGILLSGGKGEKAVQQVVAEEGKREEKLGDVSLRRQVTIFLVQGKELFHDGDYAKALNRFNEVLELDPQQEEARKYVDLIQEKLRLKEEEAAELRRSEEERKSGLERRLAEARRLMGDGRYADAGAEVEKARLLRIPDRRIDQLDEEITEKLETERAGREKRDRRAREVQGEADRLYEQGSLSFGRGDYYQALLSWRKLVDLKIGDERSRKVERQVTELKDLLMEKTKREYEAGVQAQSKGELSKALTAWSRVLDVYPEHPYARERMDKVQGELSEEAKALFQEGLVYEGINRIDKAMEKWREVVRLMPIATDPYHKKAQAKLSEYGK